GAHAPRDPPRGRGGGGGRRSRLPAGLPAPGHRRPPGDGRHLPPARARADGSRLTAAEGHDSGRRGGAGAPRVSCDGMAAQDQVKADLAVAMKAGERTRVGALRLVLSELQKAAKEGDGDEVAVLRRERKRRLDAAEQYRGGGRSDLAEQEETEARLIEGYLPAELSDQELDRL